MIPLKDDIPSGTFPFVTVAFIVIDVLIFVYQLSLGLQGAEAFIYKTAAIPYEIIHFRDVASTSAVPAPLTLFTSLFVHGGLLHLLGNMLFLWIFGDNVEDTFGHLWFLVFYIFAGVMASVSHIMLNPSSTVPMVGASGAIAGVLGAYFMLFPRANVKTLVFLFFFVTIARIPAIIFLGFWFLVQIMSTGVGDSTGGGIAWYAHISGFIVGIITVLVFRPRKKTRYRDWHRGR